jgi:hypothetical protein
MMRLGFRRVFARYNRVPEYFSHRYSESRGEFGNQPLKRCILWRGDRFINALSGYSADKLDPDAILV